MNIEDFSLLADHVSTIDGTRTERLAEVNDRIQIARRRRTAVAIGSAAALTAAVVAIGSVVARSGEDTEGPVENPPLPTVKPIEEPPGQTEIAADYEPQDVIHGNVVLGSATNEPHATEIQANLPHLDTDLTVVAGFCRASEDIWWVANGAYGQCSPDAVLEATPPVEFQPLGNAPYPLPEPQEDMETPVGMWLTGPLSAQARRCIVQQIVPDSTLEQCLESDPDVTVVKNADATFGFTAYLHSAPLVVDDPLDRGSGFEALANVDGTDYLFTRGVASAPGADRIAMYLEPSEQPRLVLLVTKNITDELPMLVDGERASFPTDLLPGSPWYQLRFGGARSVVPPGSHNITVDLPRGTKAALLVYEAQSQE